MIRIVLAEDQGLLSSALSTLLSLEEDIEVAGLGVNGKEALKLIRELDPDVCLLDIEMPEMTGLDVAEVIHQEKIRGKVIILTTFARDGYFERAMKCGVSGYLLKDTPSDELIANIRGVLNGRKFYASELVSRQFQSVQNPLTDREREVLTEIQQGLSTKEVAAALFLSEGTVRNYMSEILSKTGGKNRMEALKIAKENGWV